MGVQSTYNGEYYRIQPGEFFVQCYDRDGYLWNTQRSEITGATMTMVGASVLAMATILY